MPAAPGTPFEVIEPPLVLEFPVRMLDPPTPFGEAYEFPPRCRGREVREEEPRGLLVFERPFGDQPALAAWFNS